MLVQGGKGAIGGVGSRRGSLAGGAVTGKKKSCHLSVRVWGLPPEELRFAPIASEKHHAAGVLVGGWGGGGGGGGWVDGNG